MVIRDSLSYFLGLFEQDDVSEDEGEDFDEEEEEEESKGKKKK